MALHDGLLGAVDELDWVPYMLGCFLTLGQTVPFPLAGRHQPFGCAGCSGHGPGCCGWQSGCDWWSINISNLIVSTQLEFTK